MYIYIYLRICTFYLQYCIYLNATSSTALGVWSFCPEAVTTWNAFSNLGDTAWYPFPSLALGSLDADQSQNPFCFRETILPRKRIFHPLVVSVFVGGWFLHIYGSVTILVSARVFGWLVMPLVRAFDPEQQQLEDRLLVANRSNNSSLRLHYMAAMFCNWGIKKMEKMNLWSQVCRACQSVLMFFLFYESICLATWQRK